MVESLQKSFLHIQWIISWHELTHTPKNLGELYHKVSQFSATYYKIATLAHSSLDALRMLKFTRDLNREKKRVCGICMGPLGQPTRILAGMVRSPFTFASLEKGKETASGQLTAEELVEIYRFAEINEKTQLFGLIGRPVDQSYSHFTHNAVLKQFSFNAVYLKFLLQDAELPAFLDEIIAFPIKGLSVTFPFKEKILFYLKRPHRLSACNTLMRKSKGWEGCNTDGIGAFKALRFSRLKDQKMIILGAGGTAKAIAQVAHQKGACLTILNRTLTSAERIAKPLKAHFGPLEKLPYLIQSGYHCLIQATPVGMAPTIGEMPVPVEWKANNILALDVISNPRQTRFLSEIKKRGGKIISGIELFIYQAIEQFIYWFNCGIVRKQVEMTIRRHLPYMKQSSAVRVKRSALIGSLILPSSKSHTIRAILLAALTKGKSLLHHILDSPDTTCAVRAACQFGAKVTSVSTGLEVIGVAGFPQIPDDIIDAGNSGQVLRFASALAALSKGYTAVTGDKSIRFNRPIQPLLDGLNGLNAWAVSTRGDGYAPLIVQGPLQPGVTYLDGQDSQPVSALLMAAAFIEGKTEIHVQNAGEKPWLALTLSWLDLLGVSYTHRNLEHFVIQGKRTRAAFEVTIPGDLSSLAFPMVAALITNSELLIQRVDLQDIQGDKALVFLLLRMGARLEIDESLQQLKILSKSKLKGQIIDANGFIDAVPILAVLGCFAEGETQIINASIARQKESNRLACIVAELKKMGASIEETEDGLRVEQSQLKGTCVTSHQDHRLAMSLIVAGLGAEGETEVLEVECINKSYPSFLVDFKKIGAQIDADKI